MRDGFDIHHLDGSHANNDPANLVLIETTDHMRLHGGSALRRIGTTKGTREKTLERGRLAYELREQIR